MRIRSALLSFSLLLLTYFSGPLFISAPVFAQADEKEKVQKEAEKRQELERKTLALLDETVAGAWGLKLPENRSFVLETAADLLWAHDEKRARNLFWDALNSLAPTTNPEGDDSATKSPTTKDSTAKDSITKNSTTKVSANNKLQTLNQYYAIFTARQEFLRKVAKRDPQLALEMLRATRLSPPEPVNSNYRLPDERDLEQGIASEAATRDPKRALQIARESLAKGLSFQLLGLLYQLNQQDQEAASELAGDIIAKLDSENLETSIYGLLIAMQLLETSRTPKDVVVDNAPTTSRIKSLKLNDGQKQTLVDMITNAALSISAKGNILQNISRVMPEIEQFAPDRAARLKTKLAEFNRALSKNQQDWNTYNSLFRNGTPEEMLKAAGTVGDETRNSLYREAVIKAVMSGKADTLREFINNHVEDESRRKSLTDSLDAEQISFAAERGKTEELEKLLPQIRLKEQRARAMAELAILLEKKGEHDEALKLLDQAQALVKVDLRSETQSDALMAVMLAYSLVDPAKAFALIEPIIDRTNDNISKLLLLDKVIKSGVVKNGEIILQQSGVVSIDFAVFKYGKGVTALANADFNRTKAEADRFQRHELRIMARLLIANALLRSTEEVPKNNEQ